MAAPAAALAPPIHPAQAQVALQRANRIRRRRAAAKRHLAATPFPASLRRAAELIEDPPPQLEEALEGMRLGQLIAACRGIGNVKVLRLLAAAGTTEDTRLGSLAGDQRHRIGGVLRGWAA